MRLSLLIVVMALTVMIKIDAKKYSGGYKSAEEGYNKEDKCYSKGYPRTNKLSVGYGDQSPKLKRTIHYVLKEYPAVKEALKNSHIECEKAYNYYRYYDGQEETCPTELQLVTKVYIGEEWCDVAKPDYQCVTAASCQTPKEPCAGYQKWPRTSSCMYAGFRYFRVWVFCRSCGFKLIKLKSPQCCSCWTFQMCEGDGGGR